MFFIIITNRKVLFCSDSYLSICLLRLPSAAVFLLWRSFPFAPAPLLQRSLFHLHAHLFTLPLGQEPKVVGGIRHDGCVFFLCRRQLTNQSQTTAVTLRSFFPPSQSSNETQLKKLLLQLSYLVCVDVGGAVASAAAVASEVTQEPPGQAGQIPLVEGNIQFGSFAGWARQTLKRVWTRFTVKAWRSDGLSPHCWTWLDLPSSGSRGRLWEGVCSRGPSLTASGPVFTGPLQIYRGTEGKLEPEAKTEHLEDSQLLF